MENKPWYTKLFEAKWYVHYTIWFAVTFIVFALLMGLASPDEISTLRLVTGCSIIAAILGGMFTMINVGLKNSAIFWRDMYALRDAANNATDLEELRRIRKDVILLWKKHMCSHYQDITNQVLTLIDTRLKYEFKVVT